jgi:HlyD family secretion protein
MFVVLLSGCGDAKESSADKPNPRVRATAVRQQVIGTEIPVVGTILPVEVSRVASGAAGKVIEFPLREGAHVEEGELLAQLRTVGLNIEIEAAKALLREREQVYDRLASGYRPEEIAQATARLKKADASVQFSKASLERLRNLRESNAGNVTVEQLDESIMRLEQSVQEQAEAQADYDLKSSGYRSEEVAEANAAREAQHQEVLRLEDELAKRTVVAPFSGYLVEKHTDLGEWVEMGGTVATLVRLDEVEVRVNVEESFIHEVSTGQSVEVRVDAVSPEPFPGVVKYIVPRSQWESGSRSFPVIVRVTNRILPDGPQLKEGMIARLTFIGRPRDAMLAHKDAILRTSGRPMVYVVDSSSGVVRSVEVEEGIGQGGFVEVSGNLKPGDLLVTEGVERLRPFDTVEIMPNTTPNGQTAESPPQEPTARRDVSDVNQKPSIGTEPLPDAGGQ